MLDTLGRICMVALKVALGLLSLALLAIAGWGVFSRNILDRSVVWADTANTWIFVWIVFLGATLGVVRGAHMEVGAARDALPAKVQKALILLGYVAVIVASIFLGYAGYEFVGISGDTPSPAMGADLKWVLWAFPVGCVLMAVAALDRLVRAVLAPAAELKAQVQEEKENIIEEGL